MDDLSILPRFILLVILLVCSAFFSACEAAYFSLSSFQLSELMKKRSRTGRLVNSLLEKPRELLITIYIGNELVNIAISVITTSIALLLFGDWGIGIAIGAATFLLLIFGEIVPKSMSLKFAQSYSLFAAYPLAFFSKLVQPIQKFFSKVTEKLISDLGFNSLLRKKPIITDEEFKTMVQVGEGEGTIDSEESTLIHNVIKFGETTVGDIMVPKIDMFTVHIGDGLDDILPKIIENFYSRVPVFDQEEENILGVLFTKDLNRFKSLPRENFNLNNVIRPIFSVPKSKKVKELLQEFRKIKRHMAIILDEFGSLCGLVTLEDILEELVGEIDSEMRQEESPVLKIRDNRYRLSATLTLSAFNEYFKSQLPEGDHNTIGGLVFGLFGRIPRSGENVKYENFKFRVEKMKGPRILKLHVTLKENGGSGKNENQDKEDASE
ncbi:MAG: hemolysin family protein [Nitrospinota bacterium]|nr:hemolysin family protein [Nitrospinota bacterium]